MKLYKVTNGERSIYRHGEEEILDRYLNWLDRAYEEMVISYNTEDQSCENCAFFVAENDGEQPTACVQCAPTLVNETSHRWPPVRLTGMCDYWRPK